MKKRKLYALSAAGLAILWIAGSFMDSQRAAAAGGPDTTIAGPLPLPVMGTVTANQGGAWNVGVTGTPNVNVANSPTVKLSAGTSVNVSNLPASPVPTVAQRGPLTNVGAMPSELILAVWSPMQPCASGYVHFDGTCFIVPAGEAFIITDFQWFVEGAVAGNGVVAELQSSLGAAEALSFATAGANGFVGRAEHLTTGFAATGSSLLTPVLSSGNLTTLLVTLRGYLLPNS